jgi:hypothetical protein
MISIFRKKVEDTLREFNDSNIPASTLPDLPNSESEVLGRDANLPLVIKELAPVQLSDLRKERDRLTKRLAELDVKEEILTALLAVVNK